MSNQKFFLVAVVALLIILAVLNWTQVKAAVAKIVPGSTGGGTTDTNTKAVTTITGRAPAPGLDYSKVLSKGVAGSEVLVLQQTLNKINALAHGVVVQLVEDGKFGPLTETMLKYYGGVTSVTLNQAISIYQNKVGA
jgi:hypothetical protein